MERPRVVSRVGLALDSVPASRDAICVRRLTQETPLKVRDAEGCTVMCCAGTVRITQENDAREIYLSAGESFTFDRCGLALISAEEGMKDDWLGDTGLTVVSGPERLLCRHGAAKRVAQGRASGSDHGNMLIGETKGVK